MLYHAVQVAEQLDGKVRVVKVDVDENPELSNMLKVGGDEGEGLLPSCQGDSTSYLVFSDIVQQ